MLYVEINNIYKISNNERSCKSYLWTRPGNCHIRFLKVACIRSSIVKYSGGFSADPTASLQVSSYMQNTQPWVHYFRDEFWRFPMRCTTDRVLYFTNKGKIQTRCLEKIWSKAQLEACLIHVYFRNHRRDATHIYLCIFSFFYKIRIGSST